MVPVQSSRGTASSRLRHPNETGIDESFLDFDGLRADRVSMGQELRAAVLRETGLPTSVGFGLTKTLARHDTVDRAVAPD